MNWPVGVAWLVFIGVPGLLWLLGALANRGHGFWAGVLGFAVGTDNRLSVSRVQAFLWTLVIFGSFAAAMAIHTPIKSATADQIQEAKDNAKKGADAAAAAQASYETAKTDYAKALAASRSAQDASAEAEARAAAANGEAVGQPRNAILKKAAEDAATIAAQARVEAKAQAALLPSKSTAVADAEAAQKKASSAAAAAALDAQSYAWVQIPAALLALAGIAIGSGVFSSLISAVNDDQQTASITAIATVQFGNQPNQVPLPQDPDVQPPIPGHPNSLLIRGANLGATKGTVRLHRNRFSKDLARVIYWHNDEIAIDLAPGAVYPSMTVDTSHGKLSYQLAGALPSLQLVSPLLHYEFVDLFRDDKNPDTLSLMKFQMFGWTLIAIFIYVYLFLSHLDANITTLPAVDSSIAVLTGVSQAGYLAGKGVSNVQPNQQAKSG